MNKLEKLDQNKKALYTTGYFSGDYNQELYIKRANDDGSNRPKYYLIITTTISGEQIQQGYLYFYLDFNTKTSYFIGLKVQQEYRNLNIGSLLIANWIDLCYNNGYNFLGVNAKQRKPFLLYLLKTYGFEIIDKSLYEIRQDVISIYKNPQPNHNEKLLLFKNKNHEEIFMKTKIYKADNYKIIHTTDNIILLDNIILPLQNRKKNQVNYELLDQNLAKTKTKTIISRHKK